ncbi:MAG: histidine kinase, partial [Acidimicrobiales bacterium]
MRRTSLLLAGTCLAGTVAGAWARGLPLIEGLPVMVVGTLFVVTGVVASTRRPDNPSGRLLGLTGLAWLLSVALTTVGNAVAFTAGLALFPLGLAPLAHLAVAFPGGRLRTPFERRLVVGVYGVAVAALPIVGTSTCQDCGTEVVGLDIRRGAGRIWYSVLLLAVFTITVGVLAVLARRWQGASPAARRILLPVLPGACFFGAVYLVAILAELGVPTGLGDRWAVLALILIGAAPLVYLGGLLRSRLARGDVSRVVVELGESSPPNGLRDALALALGDPSLQLAYWRPDGPGYVDPDSSPVALPADGTARAVAVIERRGRRVGALVYDAALHDDPALVDSVAEAAGLAMENESLHAEVLARLEEVRTSRARIVLAGDQARRRVERDLHDGAQQRLVALAMAIGLARARLGPAADPAVDDLLRQASEEPGVAGAARAGPGPAPVGPDRGGAGRRPRLLGRAVGRAGHRDRDRRGAAPGAGRGGRLLRGRRGAGQRGQARGGLGGRGA